MNNKNTLEKEIELLKIKLNELEDIKKNLVETTQKLESEKEFSSKLTDTANVIVLILDIDANITLFNNYSENLTGYRREEVIGKNWFELFIPKKNGNTIPAVFNDVLKEMPDVVDYVNPILCKDGIEKEISWRNNILKDNKNQIIGVLSFGIDLSEIKEAERSLKESEESYRDLFSNIPDAVIIFDTETNLVLDYNQAAIERYGYTKEEFLSFTPHNLHPSNELEEVDKNISEEKKTGEHYYTHIAKDGNRYLVEVLTDFTVYKGKKAYVSIIRDVTRRKKMEDELKIAKENAEQSDVLKSAFLANMSHEIRTPMNAIIGFSSLLDNADSEESRNEFTQIIKKNGEHLLSIINDIIDISKIEAGMVNIEKEKCNINLILDELFYLYNNRGKIKNNKIKILLHKVLPNEEALIISDNTRIRQILINLLENAYKFTSEGKIEYGYTCLPDRKNLKYLEFYIKDTGEGIAIDKQKLIFERFMQADVSTTRVHQGTGLGLAITQAIVNIMGGQIKLQSEPGKGSSFFFTIPYKIHPDNKVIPMKKTIKPDINNRIILVAEDDNDSYYLIENILKLASVNVLRAVNGEDAVNQCKNNSNIDLVLMDMRMPVLTGYEATTEIKKFLPDLPIIAQTAYAIKGDKEKILESGCDDYIPKPINPTVLIELVNSWLAKSK